MKETHEFLVPDYYPDFHCKMGACRHSCCEGWPVTLSLEDYFHMMNIECGPELRGRLDLALKVCRNPTPEEYAEISHDYLGQCRLRMADGRCALHAEEGEDALSPVCRLYPRGVRAEGDYECSCACSCERTLEMLYARKEPMTFVQYRMEIDMPMTVERSVFFETVGREQEIRLHFIRIVQNRRLPLYLRLVCLTDAIADMENALAAGDADRVDSLIRKPYDSVTDFSAASFRDLRGGLMIAERLGEIVDERSDGVREYGEKALAYFGSGEGVLERYLKAAERFEEICPDWEPFFENILVNHMFFSRFPFQDRPDSLPSEKSALDAVYAVMRFLAVGNAMQLHDMGGVIDILSALFRLVDHSSFESGAGRILDELGCRTRQKQLRLLEL